MTVVWVVVAIAVTLFAAWAYFTAQRLDRLHTRLDRSREALQAALDRRAAVVAAVVPQLRERARAIEEVRLDARDVDSRLELERTFAADLVALTDEVLAAPEVRRELQDAQTRVFLALRFYNEAVSDTRDLRLRPLVRVLRLGGTAALPEYAALEELELN
ncbi:MULTISPECIES: hypothetical protein [unclassified Corynebacterium]|uniref:hypothetical protein n=1 Tax=unclassified Corynebacterium TaxID=2624378 RepID=UPI0008A5A689|nr:MULTISPECIES: hypothetical protein [unclassified Corynebacterium]OFP35670.1 hypothetical protein HMPREF2990_08000 [Corynebacterium sp. HMSC071B10]OHF36489.1 hypothetical protein HMPREF2550_07420 [Corynebacterium sp. HMSC074A01]